MKKLLFSLLIICLLFTNGFTDVSAKDNVQVSGQRVNINYKISRLKGFLINNANYFKLRDFARAMSLDGDEEFDIQWYEEKKAIVIVPEQKYIALGTELSAVPPKIKSISVSNVKIMLQGIPYYFDAYNINGHNYFKLRDICALLGLGVSYDADLNEVLIDTDRTYYEAAYDEIGKLPKLIFQEVKSEKYGVSFEVPNILKSLTFYEDGFGMMLFNDNSDNDKGDDSYTYLSVGIQTKKSGETMESILEEEKQKSRIQWTSTHKETYKVQGADQSYLVTFKDGKGAIFSILIAEKKDKVYMVDFFTDNSGYNQYKYKRAIEIVKNRVYQTLKIK